MLELYHADTAVCAAKVRVTLAEKGLAYESHLLNLSNGDQFAPAYMALNPNAVVPTLVHDGVVVTESTVVNEYIEDAFPQPPLRPADLATRARMRLWTKREDTIHDAINTMTNVLIFGPILNAKSPEERAKRYEKMPDPARRAKWKRLLEQGLASADVDEALTRFARLFRDMEAALAKGPWLTGADFTLADIGFISFFYRLEMLRVDGIWHDPFPRVTDWFERCKARPSFAVGVRDPIAPAAFASYSKVGDAEAAEVGRRFAAVLAGL